MSNLFEKWSVEERKAILDTGKSHPEYKALMAAYDAHNKAESRRIDAQEAEHYSRLGLDRVLPI